MQATYLVSQLQELADSNRRTEKQLLEAKELCSATKNEADQLRKENESLQKQSQMQHTQLETERQMRLAAEKRVSKYEELLEEKTKQTKIVENGLLQQAEEYREKTKKMQESMELYASKFMAIQEVMAKHFELVKNAFSSSHATAIGAGATDGESQQLQTTKAILSILTTVNVTKIDSDHLQDSNSSNSNDKNSSNRSAIESNIVETDKEKIVNSNFNNTNNNNNNNNNSKLGSSSPSAQPITNVSFNKDHDSATSNSNSNSNTNSNASDEKKNLKRAKIDDDNAIQAQEEEKKEEGSKKEKEKEEDIAAREARDLEIIALLQDTHAFIDDLCKNLKCCHCGEYPMDNDTQAILNEVGRDLQSFLLRVSPSPSNSNSNSN